MRNVWRLEEYEIEEIKEYIRIRWEKDRGRKNYTLDDYYHHLWRVYHTFISERLHWVNDKEEMRVWNDWLSHPSYPADIEPRTSKEEIREEFGHEIYCEINRLLNIKNAA